jgi:hypothetical protein
MSADKFSRILRVVIAEHLFKDEQNFLLHIVPLRLCSKKEFELKYRKEMEKALNDGFDYLASTTFGRKLEKELN